MREKGYYSTRTGKHPAGAKLDISGLRKLFLAIYRSFLNRDYFQEHFGYFCVDLGDVAGLLGDDIPGVLLVELRKEDIWPISEHLSDYSEDDVFDLIEYLHDHISYPIDGYFHSYSNCGMHYSTFNRQQGQVEFRESINRILAIYGDGYILSSDGEILELPDPSLSPLLEADLPSADSDNVSSRVEGAVRRFRRHHSSLEDRRHALRDLADVLEFLRPKLRSVITSKDEGDLFNLANNFGIRHHNEAQKTGYDAAIWYSWLFYYYLATVHACVRLLERQRDDA
jgi:hypothetical protein